MTWRVTALHNFWSEETQSQYVGGLSYTVADERLRELAVKWIVEGKVVEGGPEAIVSGKE